MKFKSHFPKVFLGIPALRKAARVALGKGSE